jgi:hypothetical protein
LAVSIPNRLYHYTSESSRLAIIESKILFPSLEREDGMDALFGSGQYFTNVAPEQVVSKSRANSQRPDFLVTTFSPYYGRIGGARKAILLY